MNENGGQILGLPAMLFARWLLFIPAGLISGIALCAYIALMCGFSGDSDIEMVGVYFGLVAGGCCSVLVGMRVSPAYPRVVAVSMGFVCLSFSAVVLWWATSTQKDLFIFYLSAALYSIGATLTALTALRMKQ